MSKRLDPNEARMMTLFANIKKTKKLDLDQAIKYINISKIELEELIKDLVAKDKIAGKFIGFVFNVQSNVDRFVNILEEKFIK